MDPIVLIPYTIFVLGMGGLWLKDETVSNDTVASEERFVLDDQVYQCSHKGSIYEPETVIVRVPKYIEKDCPKCPKVPVKQRPKPTKLKTECK